MKAWSEAAWQVPKGPAVCAVSSLQWQPLTGDVDVGMIAATSSLRLQCPRILGRARWLAGAASHSGLRQVDLRWLSYIAGGMCWNMGGAQRPNGHQTKNREGS